MSGLPRPGDDPTAEARHVPRQGELSGAKARLSRDWLTWDMTGRGLDRAAARSAARAAQVFREDLERLRADAGISIPELAAGAHVGTSYLYRIIAGESVPSDATRARLAVALGADLSVRLYPNTGPVIRDRHQGAITEMLLREHHPRWHGFGEVRVVRPSRGWIDVAFHEARERVIVATEVQSELRRVEQLIRWAAEKAASLPSWDGWDRLGELPQISRLLVVRRTRATRAVAAGFAHQLRLSYPAHPDDAIAALTGGSMPWPGAAIVWAEVAGGRARLLQGR
jgi:transcriptional regulator with XRE-family HTH domain